jgi:CheY-like chemotaxis protein
LASVAENAPEGEASVLVLVAEDEVLTAQTLGLTLEEDGYEVLLASSGTEAVRLLEADEHPIRAIITGIDLGEDVKGWDVARRARELHPGIPVVYITGGSSQDRGALGVPQSQLITKPFAPAQVTTAVSQLLNAPPIPPTPPPTGPPVA